VVERLQCQYAYRVERPCHILSLYFDFISYDRMACYAVIIMIMIPPFLFLAIAKKRKGVDKSGGWGIELIVVME